MKVTRQERGWAGHFICANRCRFRRNTLLTCGNTMVVVSTVGLMENRHGSGFDTVGHDRYYETMAFHSHKEDTRYHDIDVSRRVSFDSPWAISELDADDKADDMHEAVVKEIIERLESGSIRSS